MESTGNLSVIFVGCGGTFWYANPIFSATLKKLDPQIRPDGRVIFIDPDDVEEHNTTRQWCCTPTQQRVEKVLEAELLTIPYALEGQVRTHRMNFQKWVDSKHSFAPSGPVLVIVNVDNNLARLEVRSWALQRASRTIMVVSGCELNHGQVYYGAYGAGGILTHDWLLAHPDVAGLSVVGGPTASETGECGAQSVVSNALTAALFAPALEETVKWLTPGLEPTLVNEWYWGNHGDGGCNIRTGLVHRMWTSALERLPEQRELDER